MATDTCVAVDRGCGTPTGWRKGGRCVNCRRAHNEDTARRSRARNAPPLATINAYAARITAGEDPADVARSLGINHRQAQVLHLDHPQVAQAVAKLVEGRAARQAAYLKALIDSDGSTTAARSATYTPEGTVSRWRREDEKFAATERSIKAWAESSAPRRPGSHATRSQYELFIKHLADQSVSMAAAAQKAGLNLASTYRRAERDADFAKRLNAIRPKPESGQRSQPPRHSQVTGKQIQQLVESLNAGISVTASAAQVGMSRVAVYQRAKLWPELATALAARRNQKPSRRRSDKEGQ